MIRAITQEQILHLIEQAAQSERKRAPFNLHEYHEPVQRMINALLPGTYVTPHKHENPDKVELIAVMVGKVALFHFSEGGEILNQFVLQGDGPVRAVDIPPRTYHNMIALEPSAVLEIIQGPYDPATHKQFAPWAPKEGTAETVDYLRRLEELVSDKM
jgi:cupin fold WbuC family metalloprotein